MDSLGVSPGRRPSREGAVNHRGRVVSRGGAPWHGQLSTAGRGPVCAACDTVCVPGQREGLLGVRRGTNLTRGRLKTENDSCALRGEGRDAQGGRHESGCAPHAPSRARKQRTSRLVKQGTTRHLPGARRSAARDLTTWPSIKIRDERRKAPRIVQMTFSSVYM